MRLSLGVGPVLAPVGAALLLLVAALPLADGGGLLGGVRSAVAQSAPSSKGRKAAKRPLAKPAAKEAGADTDRQLDAAAKSLTDGNADAAMTTLDGILSQGGLANNHMARALYLRGLAHRKKARPAQAIADLTSAVWLKGGLSDADRTAALKERSEISREIGVADGGAPPASVTAASPAPAAPTASTAQPPAAQTGLLKRPPPVSAPGGLTEGGFPRVVATAPPAATPPAPRTPNAGKATSSWQSGTSVENGAAAEKPAGAPASGGGVGEFFSGLFGGGAPASPPPAERAARSAAKSSDAPAWSTSVRSPSSRNGAEKHAQKSAPVVTSSAPSAADASGKYRLQIAAVRSRKEADAVAARIRKEHGRVIGARKLEVDETVFGNMGTFYRVRLGPFAAAGESKAVCDQLRTKGYDCLVVTQ